MGEGVRVVVSWGHHREEPSSDQREGELRGKEARRRVMLQLLLLHFLGRLHNERHDSCHGPLETMGVLTHRGVATWRRVVTASVRLWPFCPTKEGLSWRLFPLSSVG